MKEILNKYFADNYDSIKDPRRFFFKCPDSYLLFEFFQILLFSTLSVFLWEISKL